MLGCIGSDTFLDWLLQFNAESIDLCVLQSGLSGSIQKYIGMCFSQLLEQKDTVQCILCVTNNNNINNDRFKFESEKSC